MLIFRFRYNKISTPVLSCTDAPDKDVIVMKVTALRPEQTQQAQCFVVARNIDRAIVVFKRHHEGDEIIEIEKIHYVEDEVLIERSQE